MQVLNANNNLLFDYCLHNNVAIVFQNKAQLSIICALFNMPIVNFFDRGVVHFVKDGNDQVLSVCFPIIPLHIQSNFVILSSDEFFRLAIDSSPSLINQN